MTEHAMLSILRSRFCEPLHVAAVPLGRVVTTGFMGPDGDPLSFYVIENDDGTVQFEDSGEAIPDAMGLGLIEFDGGHRETLLREMLADEGAWIDEDFVIRTDPVPEAEAGAAAMRFVSALIRVRDLALVSRENVRAVFADDVREQLERRLPAEIEIANVDRHPGAADIELRDRAVGLKIANIFAAGSDTRMLEAVVARLSQGAGDAPIVAVVDRRRDRVAAKRMEFAANKGVQLAVVTEGQTDWVDRVIQIAEEHRVRRAQ